MSVELGPNGVLSKFARVIVTKHQLSFLQDDTLSGGISMRQQKRSNVDQTNRLLVLYALGIPSECRIGQE